MPADAVTSTLTWARRTRPSSTSSATKPRPLSPTPSYASGRSLATPPRRVSSSPTNGVRGARLRDLAVRGSRWRGVGDDEPARRLERLQLPDAARVEGRLAVPAEEQ